jgi:hypothetical protein
MKCGVEENMVGRREKKARRWNGLLRMTCVLIGLRRTPHSRCIRFGPHGPHVWELQSELLETIITIRCPERGRSGILVHICLFTASRHGNHFEDRTGGLGYL